MYLCVNICSGIPTFLKLLSGYVPGVGVGVGRSSAASKLHSFIICTHIRVSWGEGSSPEVLPPLDWLAGCL